MDWRRRRCIQGSEASFLISSSSSGVTSRSSSSLPLTSMLLHSRMKSKTLWMPPLPCRVSRPMVPVMLTLSPGLAMSTMSSRSSMFTERGSWPGGSSSGLSWIVILWESMKTDSLGTSSKPRLLLQEGHSEGVLRNWLSCSR